MDSTLGKKDRKSAKICGWIATIIYPPLFLFFLIVIGVEIIRLADSGVDRLLGLSVISLYLCAVLSTPFALYRIWSLYSKERYQKSRHMCLLPISMIIIAIAYSALTEGVKLLFT